MLKIKVARFCKVFGKERKAGVDVTAQFNPANPVHMNMLRSGVLVLVKEAPKRRRKKAA